MPRYLFIVKRIFLENKTQIRPLFSLLLLLLACNYLFSQQHPCLLLTHTGVKNIRQSKADAPLFAQALEHARKEVDAEITAGIFVPTPRDMAGGYTHERHKKNFFTLQQAGNLYQITNDKKYATYVKELLLAYAKQYPKWGIHPTNRSYATGKIFWQCLNDANWLVYSSQAYDAIYDFLTAAERQLLEDDLFRPLANFISIENPKFFNRIHNHSTWGNAAVGMIGLVMNDESLVKRALYGLQDDGLDDDMLDNDGGFIKIKGQHQAGFLAQLDYSFSPDGHFTEGPYYLRYAMTPFLLFAKSLHHNRPKLNIYAYRDSILRKSIYSLLYETDAQGRFFPINDAQKGMSWKSREVVAAVDIAYSDFGNDPMLLSIAQKQGRVTIDEAGFRTAMDLAAGRAISFEHRSISYRDGAKGQKGGLGILRMDNKSGSEICLVAKYAAHGMGHGHFDKLSYSLYDEDGEIIQDYGAARWVNIDQKGGGRYLPENQSYAKQSIAHNTLVINQVSHYNAQVKRAETYHPEQYFFEAKKPNVQIVSAKEKYAYMDTEMHRTLVLFKDEHYKNPLVIDVFRVQAQQDNQYDLPIWFQGHLLQTDFEYNTKNQALTTLGHEYGYQHLWQEATGYPTGNSHQITWLTPLNDGGSQARGKITTLTTATTPSDELIFARIGASDPHFNLRRDPAFICRRKASSTVFATVIESHGTYDPVSEIPSHPFPQIQSVEVVHDSETYTAVQLADKDGKNWLLIIANQNNDEKAAHSLIINDKKINWTGVYQFTSEYTE